MRRHWQYLKYVLRHKWYVFLECRKLGVPLLIALAHDWDKFLPDEWFAYARCFYKPDGSRQYDEGIDFTVAWLLHQQRNKHHWQNWVCVDGIPLSWTNVLIWDRGNAEEVKTVETDFGPMTLRYDVDPAHLMVREMSDVYRREMLADWRGAGKALGFPDTAAWYEKNKANIRLHPDTRAWLEAAI